MRTLPRLLLVLIIFSLAACSPAAVTPTASLPAPTEAATATSVPTVTPLTPASQTPQPSTTLAPSETPLPSPTADIRQLPADWQNWPVVPKVSPWLKGLYAKGLAEGNNPNAFSKVGDCQNVISLFLSPFDTSAEYRLGEAYAYLQPTIDQFAGSWERKSLAVKGGFNVASVLSPMMSDKTICGKDESPLDCEFRLNKPSIVIISMETWWSKRPAETYEGYLRKIVEYVLAHNVVPILATKADNLEGDMSINAAVAQVAYDYDLPMWNFWAAVQTLPDKGLTSDGFHLTVGTNYYDDPEQMKEAWPNRNLTALQAIDAVWKAVR